MARERLRKGDFCQRCLKVVSAKFKLESLPLRNFFGRGRNRHCGDQMHCQWPHSGNAVCSRRTATKYGDGYFADAFLSELLRPL